MAFMLSLFGFNRPENIKVISEKYSVAQMKFFQIGFDPHGDL